MKSPTIHASLEQGLDGLDAKEFAEAIVRNFAKSQPLSDSEDELLDRVSDKQIRVILKLIEINLQKEKVREVDSDEENFHLTPLAPELKRHSTVLKPVDKPDSFVKKPLIEGKLIRKVNSILSFLDIQILFSPHR